MKSLKEITTADFASSLHYSLKKGLRELPDEEVPLDALFTQMHNEI